MFSSSILKPSTNSMSMDMSAAADRSPTTEQILLLELEVIMDDGDPWVDTADSVDRLEMDDGSGALLKF